MLAVLLSHWAVYLLLGWLAEAVVVNLWPTKKKDGQGDTVRREPKRALKESMTHPFLVPRETIQRKQ